MQGQELAEARSILLTAMPALAKSGHQAVKYSTSATNAQSLQQASVPQLLRQALDLAVHAPENAELQNSQQCSKAAEVASSVTDLQQGLQAMQQERDALLEHIVQLQKLHSNCNCRAQAASADQHSSDAATQSEGSCGSPHEGDNEAATLWAPTADNCQACLLVLLLHKLQYVPLDAVPAFSGSVWLPEHMHCQNCLCQAQCRCLRMHLHKSVSC